MKAIVATFVWVTFNHTTVQPYKFTPQPPLLSAIGVNGSNLRTLMELTQRKDRKGFVSTYIVPNIEAGYIAMLYPEAPNHPMQSYYLTKKGRDLLEQL